MVDKSSAIALRKWDDGFYVRAHQLAKTGLKDAAVAKGLGITAKTFAKLLELKPALAEALEEARKDRAFAEEFRGHVAGRLPEKLKDLWSRLVSSEDNDPDGEEDPERATALRRERLLLEQDLDLLRREDRQRMFLHALLFSNYSRTEACRRIGVCSQTVKGWLQDEDFRDLLAEIDAAKKDFVEGSLMGLIRQGDVASTIFASRTLNRDRGYAERVDHKVEVEVTHVVDDLDLPLDVRRQLLDALRRKEETPSLPERKVLEVTAK